MAAFLLQRLKTRREVDEAITSTEDKVLVLRFGQENDVTCMRLDEILRKTEAELKNMADIALVEVDDIPEYVSYFDISLIPATVFFFNAHHIKVDWGRPDNTKFIGTFKKKQDFIDVVETVFTGAMKGKVMVRSPLDSADVPKYSLIFRDV